MARAVAMSTSRPLPPLRMLRKTNVAPQIKKTENGSRKNEREPPMLVTERERLREESGRFGRQVRPPTKLADGHPPGNAAAAKPHLGIRHASDRRPAGHPSGRGVQRRFVLQLSRREAARAIRDPAVPHHHLRHGRQVEYRPAARERPRKSLRGNHARRQVLALLGELPGDVRSGAGHVGQRSNL